LIRRTANDPFETVEHWKKFSDPFQFVSTCRELIAAQNDPNFVFASVSRRYVEWDAAFGVHDP
jgi:DNA-dependent RNA polymerase